MILYTVKNGVYYNLEDFKEDLSDLGENGFPNKIYINMTNRCSCSCTFCLRSLKEFNEHNSLWLKEEPSVELVKELFSKYDWSHVRINTNGLSDLVFGEPTASRLAGIFDTVSISLNSSTAQKYLDVTRNRFGLASYDAMLSFAKACQRYVPNVVMTVVDVIGAEEVAACQKVCDTHGLQLRVRPYEAN